MLVAYERDVAITTALVAAGSDVDARDSQTCDLMTIAAVANDVHILKLAIASGGNPGLITSLYDGTVFCGGASR